MPKTLPVFAFAQFCMSLSWVVYAAFLPAMAAQAGLPKSAVVWLLLLDQGLFMVSDFLAGVASDRMAAAAARWANLLGVLTGVSAVALLALPLLVGAIASPLALVLPALVWVACSSALRAPLFSLVGKRANSTTGNPFRWLLLGSGVAAAFAPLLQSALKGQSPIVPFALVAASLVLCALLVGKTAASGSEAEPASAREPATALPEARWFFVALACAALALQVHLAFNAGRLFLREVPAEHLHWWMPSFWIGFNLAMLLPPLLGTWPAARRLGLFGLAGVTALSLCALIPGAGLQAGLQAAAGAAWALFLSNAFSTANAIGSPQRQGRFAGGVHAVLAAGSVLRLAMASAAVPMVLGDAMLWLPASMLAIAAVGMGLAPVGERRHPAN
jgi:MFS family permease